jgi:hypothetical protein
MMSLMKFGRVSSRCFIQPIESKRNLLMNCGKTLCVSRFSTEGEGSVQRIVEVINPDNNKVEKLHYTGHFGSILKLLKRVSLGSAFLSVTALVIMFYVLTIIVTNYSQLYIASSVIRTLYCTIYR